MRHAKFTCTLLAAFPLVIDVAGLHIDFTGNGHVAIDVDTPEGNGQPLRRVSPHETLPPPRYQSADDDVKGRQVDLGYETHQGFWTDSKNYLNFSNIPYAAPPIGEGRFNVPWYPEYNESAPVNNGTRRAICPQFQVGWGSAAKEFVHDMLLEPVLPGKWKDPITTDQYEHYEKKPQLDPESSEDCLLLDVLVPKIVWERRNNRDIKGPTIVWIHGGGFIFGSKHLFGSPEKLLDAAEGSHPLTSIIHVSINYRLGAFGFLGGEKLYEEGGQGNLGLLDQRFALEWVRDNIWRFGGSSDRITAMGQSAGASSILHHITSDPYKKPAFTKAIIQSPGFFPSPNDTELDATYSAFLNLAGAKKFEDLEKIDTKVLMQANADLTFNSSYGLFNFGPSVDGYFTRDLPSKVLKAKEQHKGISMLIGHTKFDGLFFTPPWIRNNTQLRDHVRLMYPGVPETVLDEVDKRYPIGKFEFAKEKLLKVANFLDDVAIQCNSYYLTEAGLADTSNNYHPIYRYVYNSVPAIHGADVPYTFYPSISINPPVNKEMAQRWQSYIANFTIFTDPNDEESEFWPRYQDDKREVLNFGKAGQWLIPNFEISPGKDEQDRDICKYWQDAPYYVPPKRKSSGMGQEPKGRKGQAQTQVHGNRESQERMEMK